MYYNGNVFWVADSGYPLPLPGQLVPAHSHYNMTAENLYFVDIYNPMTRTPPAVVTAPTVRMAVPSPLNPDYVNRVGADEAIRNSIGVEPIGYTPPVDTIPVYSTVATTTAPVTPVTSAPVSSTTLMVAAGIVVLLVVLL